MELKRLTTQELQDIYGVSRKTIEVWATEHGMPLIQLSPHKSYVRIDELLEWENKGRKYDTNTTQNKIVLTNGEQI